MVKLTTFLMIWCSTLVPLTVWAAPQTNDNASEPSPAARFLQAWQGFDQNYPLFSFGLAYTVVTEGWFGERFAHRETIRFGKAPLNKGPFSQGLQAEHLFQILAALGQSERLRDVNEDSGGIFSFVLLRALEVTERNRTVSLDAQARCQIDGGLPLRFIFEFTLPNGTAIESFQKLQLMFTWDDRPFNKSQYWVPAEILAEALVQRAERRAVISQKWHLEKILEVPKVEIGPPQENPSQ